MTCASSPSNNTARDRSARCNSPISARTSSRSRIPARGAMSVAPFRPSPKVKTACSSRRSTGVNEVSASISRTAVDAPCSRISCVAQTRCSATCGATRPARLRLRYADLAPVNPRIVCCALTAYPLDGPRASEPGYDYLVQGLAGWMSITGEPDAPPTKTGPSVVDFAAGLNAALALVAAVHGARAATVWAAIVT